MDEDDAILEDILTNMVQDEVARRGGAIPPEWNSPLSRASASAPPRSSSPPSATVRTDRVSKRPQSIAQPRDSFTQGPLHHSSLQITATSPIAMEDEELLAKELAHLVSPPVPFTLNSQQHSGVQDDQAPSPAANDVATTFPQPQAGSGAASNGGVPDHRLVVTPSITPVISLQEEQAVLDAILSVMNMEEESSVSGDLALHQAAAGASGGGAEGSEAQHITQILSQAELVASAALATRRAQDGVSRGQRVLHLHEHLALQSTLRGMRGTMGHPTCVSLASVVPKLIGADAHSIAGGKAPLKTVIGFSLGAVALFGEQWKQLGLCGCGDAEARGAVVSLSVSEGAETVVAGHESGTVVLWSVDGLTALRTVSTEMRTPIVRVLHLPWEGHRVIALEAAGVAQVLSFTAVMGASVYRASRLTNTPNFSASDIAVFPYPSILYLRNVDGVVSRVDTAEVPVLCRASSNPSCVVPNRYLAAAVAADAVLLYELELGLYSTSSTAVARHVHVPRAERSSELVAFTVAEQDVPRVSLCVSWGTEVELLRVIFDDNNDTSDTAHVLSLESIAVIPMTAAPLRAMCPMAGCSLIMVDAHARVLLLDATVVSIVEEYTVLAMKLALAPAERHRSAATAGAAVLAGNWMSALLIGEDGRCITCSLRPWHARLDALLQRRKYVDAMALLRSFSKEVALSTVGMSGDPSVRRRALAVYVQRICRAYIEDTIAEKERERQRQLSGGSCDTCDRGDGSSTPDTEEVIGDVITLCSRTDALDVFFGPIIKGVRELGALNDALRALVTSMERGLITQLPEHLVTAIAELFCTHLGSGPASASSTSQNPKKRVEQAFMRLEGEFNCLLHTAERFQLWRLYVSTLSLRRQRYVAALEYALSLAETANLSNDEERRSLMIDFLRTSLSGATLVEGLPAVVASQAQCVQAKRLLWARLLTTEEAEEAMMMRRVLRVDVVRVVEILCDSIRDASPTSLWRGPVAIPRGSELCVEALLRLLRVVVGTPLTLFSVPRRQHSEGAEGEEATAEYQPWGQEHQEWPGVAAVNTLVLRLSSWIVDGGVDALAPAVRHWDAFCNVVVRQLMYVFQMADTITERTHVQAQLCSFMASTAHLVSAALYDTAYRRNFRARQMARCSALLCRLKGEYVEAIDCFLDEESNLAELGLSHEVFAMLRDEMKRLRSVRDAVGDGDHVSQQSSTTGVTKAMVSLQEAIMERAAAMAQLDATALAQFVVDFLPSNQSLVMHVLQRSSGTFLRYLDELIEKGDSAVAGDAQLQNTFIELLCAHQPERVGAYLLKNDSTITYDVQLAIRATRQYNVVDAAVFLLEKTHMAVEAMLVVMEAASAVLLEVRAEVLRAVQAVHGVAQAPINEHALDRTVSTAEEGGAADERRALSESAAIDTPQTTSLLANAVTGARIAAIMKPLDDIVRMGTSLCLQHSSTLSERAGFDLLNLFVVPRQLLCRRQEEALRLSQTTGSAGHNDGDDSVENNEVILARRELTAVSGKKRVSDAAFLTALTLPPLQKPVSPCELCFQATMIDVYTRLTVAVLHRLIHVLDLPAIMQRIVRDNEHSTLGPFKVIVMDILSALSFDLEVQELCNTCIEEDVTQLGQAMHRYINGGVIPLSDTCCRCRGHLCDPAIGVDRGISSSICVFACGHSYHDACRVTEGQSVQGCPQCHRKHAQGQAAGTVRDAQEEPAVPADALASPAKDHSPALTKTAALRRLRQTRARLDRSVESYDLLKQFVGPATREAPLRPVEEALAEYTHGTGRVLLSVMPESALTVDTIKGAGDPTKRTAVPVVDLTSDDAVIATLTDAEILELFGNMKD